MAARTIVHRPASAIGRRLSGGSSGGGPMRALPPALGSTALVLGALVAVGLDVRARGGTRGRGPCGEGESWAGRRGSGRNVCGAMVDEAGSPTEDVGSLRYGTISPRSSSETGPYPAARLSMIPTVSEATSVPCSPSYIVFAVATFFHGVCLILTCLQQRGYVTDLGMNPANNKALFVAVVSGSIDAASLFLASLVPSTKAVFLLALHIIFVMGFFWSSVAWMVSSCLLTQKARGLGNAAGTCRIALASLAGASAFLTLWFGFRSTVLDKKGSRAWDRSMWLASLGEYLYGLCYSVFLGAWALPVV